MILFTIHKDYVPGAEQSWLQLTRTYIPCYASDVLHTSVNGAFDT